MKDDETVIERIRALDRVNVYGAGVMGQALKMCLESKPYDKKVHCFIVSSKSNNPEILGDTPVIGIEDAGEYKSEIIVVALNESNMLGAVEGLYSRGFKNLIMLNAAGDEWSYIKEYFFLSNQERCYIPFKMLPERI